MLPNLKSFCIVAGFLLVLSSCSRVYTPVLYHQDIAYMPKPASFDSVGTKVYASVGGNVHPNGYLRDLVYSGQADLSIGHRFKNVNIAYGGFAEFGDYKNSQSAGEDYFSDRTFGAVGGRFSANLYKQMDNADFRYIGFEAAYSHEFGDFTTYKKNVIANQDSYIDPRTDLFSIGATTEVIFHSANSQLRHGLRGFLGVTLGHNQLNSTLNNDDEAQDKIFREVFPKFSYFIKYKHCFGVIDVGGGFMGRFGYSF